MVTKTIKKAFLITALLSMPYVAIKAADDAKQQVPQLDAAQQALVEAYQNALAQLEKNQTELDEAKQELEAAKAKIKRHQNDYEALASHIETAEQTAVEAEGLNVKVAQLTANNSSLRTEVAELQTQLKDQVRALTEQIEQKELFVAQQAADLKRALGENVSLKKQVETVLSENSSLTNALGQETIASEQLKNDLSNATANAAFQQKKAAGLQVQVDGLRRQIAQNLEEIVALTTQLDSVTSVLASERKAHQEALEASQQGENLGKMQQFAQSEDTDKIAAFNEQVAMLQGQKASLTSQLGSLKETIQGLEKDLEASQKESDHKQKQIKDLMKEFETRFKDQEDFSKKEVIFNATLERMISENIGFKSKVEYNERQLESLRKQKAEAEKELSSVRAQLKEAQNAQDELAGLREENTELKNVLMATKTNLQTMSTQVEALKASHAAIDAQNAELTKNKRELEALLQRQSDLLTRTQEQVQQTKAQIADLSGQIELGGKRNVTQITEFARLQEEVARLASINNQLERDNKDLQATVASQQNQIAQLRDINRTLTNEQTSKLDTQRYEIDGLKKEIETLKAAIKEEQAKAMAQSIADGSTITALRQDNIELRQQIANRDPMPQATSSESQVLAGIVVTFGKIGTKYQIDQAELNKLQRELQDQMNDLQDRAVGAQMLYDDLIAELAKSREATDARLKAEEDAGKARQETQEEKEKRQQVMVELQRAELNITKDVALKVKDLAQQLLNITNEKTGLEQELITKGYAEGHQGALTAWMRKGKSKPARQGEIEARLKVIDGFITNLEDQIIRAINAGIAQAKQLADAQPGRR